MPMPPKSRPRLRVRPAKPADLEALLEIERRVFTTDRLSRRSMRHLLRSRSVAVMVAERDRRLDGAAVLLFRRGALVARLYSIAVAPLMNGQGVAVALLAASERLARTKRCRTIRLEVHERNKRAIALYDKAGYRRFDRVLAYYEDGGNALRYEKPLRAPG